MVLPVRKESLPYASFAKNLCFVDQYGFYVMLFFFHEWEVLIEGSSAPHSPVRLGLEAAQALGTHRLPPKSAGISD